MFVITGSLSRRAIEALTPAGAYYFCSTTTMFINNSIIAQAKVTHNVREVFVKGERIVPLGELYLQYTSVRPRSDIPELLFYFILSEEYGAPLLTTSFKNGYKLALRSMR